MLVAEWKNGADHPLIQLVEELCREGERITDEAKKDKEDLRQQVSFYIFLIICQSGFFGTIIIVMDKCCIVFGMAST